MRRYESIFSRIIFSVVVSAILSLVVFSFYKYVILGDFVLYAQVSCDSETESCFVYECDPETEEWCDAEEPYWYYKAVYMQTTDVPTCTPTLENDCPEIVCEPGLRCEEVTCDETNVEEYQGGGSCA